jgi:hypothetical protein
MARKPNGTYLQPAWEFFKYCGILAEAHIASGQEPDWFRECFDRVRQQDIEREYGLPSWWPLVVALALDFSYKITATAGSLKRFRKKLDDGRSRLKKARDELLALRDFGELPLLPLKVRGLIDETARAIDAYLEQPIVIGRKTSSVAHAVRLIHEYVEEKNPSLTRTQRENLCAELFDDVRARHGDQRRSPNCDQETPRYRDLLAKLMAKRPARPKMRKTAQKTG